MSVWPMEEDEEAAEESCDAEDLEEFLLDQLHQCQATAALGLEKREIISLVVSHSPLGP